MSTTRKITVFATRGTQQVTFESSATTIGELKPELSRNNVDLAGNQILEQSTRATLDRDDSKLPEGDTVLFLMPSKTKSGNWNPFDENKKEELCELYDNLVEAIDAKAQADIDVIEAQKAIALYHVENATPKNDVVSDSVAKVDPLQAEYASLLANS